MWFDGKSHLIYLCSHCKGFETSLHALLQSPEVNLFWKKVTHVISLLFDVNIIVDGKNITYRL